MRAMMSESPGGPESLKLMELPSKPLGKGQVRIDVKAAGVNFPDTLIIADKYQFKPPRPFAPGHEVAGDVTEVAEDWKRSVRRGWEASLAARERLAPLGPDQQASAKAALDAATRADVRRTLRTHLTEFAGPAVVVTHDAAEAMALA